jgi:hypothetical protein
LLIVCCSIIGDQFLGEIAWAAVLKFGIFNGVTAALFMGLPPPALEATHAAKAC